MSQLGFSLKDQLFNRDRVRWLAGRFGHAPGFDAPAFEAAVLERLPELELKARIGWIAEVIAAHLPDDFAAAAAVIETALPPPLDPTLRDNDFGDFILAPLGEYVAHAGRNEPRRALAALHALTQRFSMEWAIRPFLRDHPDLTLSMMRRWADDPNYHVRRLVSEGTRPRLPWAERVAVPQDARLDLLDRLHADPTRYVTRSVANHLNDIAKEDPAAVVARLTRWRRAGRQEAGELDWMTRHALRTLVKAGDPAALGLLGYAPDPPVTVLLENVTPEVIAGGALGFDVAIAARGDTDLLIDYSLALPGARGSRPPKVFKLRALRLTAGQAERLTKRHPLRADATTYTLHPGTAELRLLVNGQPGPAACFSLKTGGGADN